MWPSTTINLVDSGKEEEEEEEAEEEEEDVMYD